MSVLSDGITKNPALGNILSKIFENIISPIIALMFAVAFFIFAWGVVKMIMDKEGGENRENGKRSMLWGVVGMFIMLSAYGLVRLIGGTVGVDPF